MSKKVQKTICIFGANFMLEQVNVLETDLAGALDPKDIEHIHRMRVASRRLRSAMEHFRECLPKKKSVTWQDDIRRVTKTLGRARDLDIQIETLNLLYDEDLDEKLKPGYRRLLLRLKQRRTKAQDKVTKTLTRYQDEGIFNKLQQQFEDMAANKEGLYLFTPSLYQKAYAAVNQHLDDFLSYQTAIQKPENIEALHAMRIAGKHFRYTLEIFAPIYKQALLPYIQIMKDIQDQLGAIHDSDVWIAWLPKFIEEEKERIEDYFGNAGPLKRLLPGIQNLIEIQQKIRTETYHAFLAEWETLQREQAWENLRNIISAPVNVEAALQHLAAQQASQGENPPQEPPSVEGSDAPQPPDSTS